MFIPLVCFGQTNQATAYAYYRNGMDKYKNQEYYQARQFFYEASKYYVWPQLKYAYGISLYLTGEKNNGCKYISEASSEGLTIGSDWVKACSENSQNNSNSYVDSENKYKRTYSNSNGIKKTTSSNSGADRAKEIAKKFDENKSSPKRYSPKYSKSEKNYRAYLKTGDYKLYSEDSYRSEVLYKIKGGVYYRVIKKGLSYALIETDNGEKGYIQIYSLEN